MDIIKISKELEEIRHDDQLYMRSKGEEGVKNPIRTSSIGKVTNGSFTEICLNKGVWGHRNQRDDTLIVKVAGFEESGNIQVQMSSGQLIMWVWNSVTESGWIWSAEP